MPQYFGTDGIRGVANATLTTELAVRVGRAVALACRDGVLGPAGTRPRVLIGMDTRPSGPMLEAALVAGLCSGGADVLRCGIVPTPAIAALVADHDASAGVVVSASHNPAPDNGIKLFKSGGWKLSARDEEAVETYLSALPDAIVGPAVGTATDLPRAGDAYARRLLSAVPGGLAGLEVVIDCANGAAYDIGPRVLADAGASVTAINADHDPARINDACGATRPDVVAAEAASRRVIGLTLDGDADRLLAADESGRIVDGDAIVALLAADAKRAGRLARDMVAVTVMSNQALRRWLSTERIGVVETPVGDRYVLEAMRTEGLTLGGEQSGHIVSLDAATTGDGLLTALKLLQLVAAGGGRLADLVPFRPLPQVLMNVRCDRPREVEGSDDVADAVEEARRQLSDTGRILLRPSGTEPVVRVMVEAPTHEEAETVAARVAKVVERAATAASRNA